MTHLPRLLVGRAAVAVLASFALALPVAAPALGAVSAPAPRSPAVPPGLPAGIERPASYVPAVSCDPAAKPGTVKLAKLLKTTYPNTSYGTSRTCGTVANSEHIEGRAVDWMNTSRDATHLAQANAMLGWLMATDKAGHPQANLHRLGIMYIIWKNRIWSAYSADQGWRPYNNCANRPARSDDSACHRDHVHFSLSWEGAMGRTSFWTKTVAAVDYGPCRVSDLNWAPQSTRANPNRCARYARVTARPGGSATHRGLNTYSGITLRLGAKGAPVSAVQRAVGAKVDGDFGPATRSSVKAWQTAHDLSPNGVVDVVTWRALLRLVR